MANTDETAETPVEEGAYGPAEKAPEEKADEEKADEEKVTKVIDPIINGDFERFLKTIKDRRADTIAGVKGFCPSLEIEEDTKTGKVTVTFLSGFKQYNFRQTFETKDAWEEWVTRARKEGSFNFF